MTDQRQTRFCGECGEALASTAKSCSSCGTELSQFGMERPEVENTPSPNPVPSEAAPNDTDTTMPEDLKQELSKIYSHNTGSPSWRYALVTGLALAAVLTVYEGIQYGRFRGPIGSVEVAGVALTFGVSLIIWFLISWGVIAVIRKLGRT